MTVGPIGFNFRILPTINAAGRRLCEYPIAIFLLAANLATGPATANVGSSAICETAAQAAASQTGVPVAVLQAISLTETGRKKGGELAPWPWTVNMEGKGDWFESRQSALAYANKHFQRGARSFDVGCFQLNYKWHGKAFSSIDEMFEPDANALYAARFLRDLYVEKGNWSDAAGAYHSRNPSYSEPYIKRFDRILASLSPNSLGMASNPTVASIETPRPEAANIATISPNQFPLLQAGSATKASLGSLMPESAGIGARGLFGRD